MHSIASVRSSSGAADYFANDNYYTADEHAEAGVWGGEGARAHQDADGLCSDCPEKAATTHPHSASEERKADCIHCVEPAIYA